MTDPDKIRLHDELLEAFRVIDTCLATYYAGAAHMFRPLAAQLRILLCDTPPLLLRLFPTLAITPIRAVEWYDIDDPAVWPDGLPPKRFVYSPGQELRVACMPFKITRFANGLQVADIEMDVSRKPLPLSEWVNQHVTTHPSDLTAKDVIRLVANKGGGAHVDPVPGERLQSLILTGPSGVGVHQLFMVAFGRLAQEIGLHYGQFRERFGYEGGRLEDMTFQEDHSTVRRAAKVPAELVAQQRNEFRLTVVKRIA